MRPIDFWEFVYWQAKLDASAKNEEEVKGRIHRFAQLKDEIAGIMGVEANSLNPEFTAGLRAWVSETAGERIDEGEIFLQRVKETKERLSWQKEGLDSARVFGYLTNILNSHNVALDFESRAPPKVAEQISLAKKMAKESQAKPLASRQINEFLAVYNQELVRGLAEEIRFDLSLRFARETPVFIPSYLESAIKVIQEKVVSNPQLLEKYLSGVSSREREDYKDKLLA